MPKAFHATISIKIILVEQELVQAPLNLKKQKCYWAQALFYLFSPLEIDFSLILWAPNLSGPIFVVSKAPQDFDFLTVLDL